MASVENDPKPTPQGGTTINVANSMEKAAEGLVSLPIRTTQQLLELGAKHGYATLLSIVLIVFFGLPIRDGHIAYLKEQTESGKKLAENGQQLAKNGEQVVEAVKAGTETSKAIRGLVETLIDGSASSQTQSAENLELTQKTHGKVEEIGVDVKEIRAYVLPHARPSGTSKRPTP